MMSKHKTETEWMALIQTYRSSGLTDRSWCEQNVISIHTFYNTISKFRKKSCVIPKSFESRGNELPEIVPVSVRSEGYTSTGCVWTVEYWYTGNGYQRCNYDYSEWLFC